MTKIFCDIADINLIKKFNRKSIVKGFTTNPSLIRKAGAKNYSKYCKNILKITKKPISFEIFADDKKNIINQALKIKNWGKQVYVKIPVTNSKGVFSDKVINKLSNKGIKLNITAVYTVNQVKKIMSCINKNSDAIISIFAGRMGDAGKDPIPIIKKSVQLAKKIKTIKVLWASTREAYNYIQAKNCGCSIITMPPSIIEKISKFGKSYNELSLDTVKKFLKDSKQSKFKI